MPARSHTGAVVLTSLAPEVALLPFGGSWWSAKLAQQS